jgi:hypothetical protein
LESIISRPCDNGEKIDGFVEKTCNKPVSPIPTQEFFFFKAFKCTFLSVRLTAELSNPVTSTLRATHQTKLENMGRVEDMLDEKQAKVTTTRAE